MKLINIDENYNITNENDIDEKTSKFYFKDATRLYTRNKIELKKDELFKVFTTSNDYLKSKIVVTRDTKILENNIKVIANTIETDTFYHLNISDYDDVNLYTEVLNERTDKGILDEKRFQCLQMINYLFELTLEVIAAVTTSFGIPFWILILKICIDRLCMGTYDKVCMNNWYYGDGIDVHKRKKFINLFCTGITGIMDVIVRNSYKAIRNVIGDMKNKNKHHRLRAFFKSKNSDTKVSKISYDEEMQNEKNKYIEKVCNEIPLELTDSYMKSKSEYVLNAINYINDKELKRNYLNQYKDIVDSYNNRIMELTDENKKEYIKNITFLEERIHNTLFYQGENELETYKRKNLTRH